MGRSIDASYREIVWSYDGMNRTLTVHSVVESFITSYRSTNLSKYLLGKCNAISDYEKDAQAVISTYDGMKSRTKSTMIESITVYDLYI